MLSAPHSDHKDAQSSSRPSFKGTIRPWVLAGATSTLLVVGTLASWGFTAPIASAVIAVGRVTVETNRKRIAHLEGGIVDELLIQNGSKIEAGDVLVKLDRTRAKSRLAIVESAMDQNLARLARLSAETSGTETISFPEQLISRQDMLSVKELIDGQESVFEARRLSRQGEKAIFEQRIEQLNEEISGFYAQLDSERKRKVIVDREVKSLENLLKRGLIGQQRVLALQREAIQMEGSIGVITANIARSKQAIGETRLQIVQGQKDFHQEVLLEVEQVRAALTDLSEQAMAASKVLEHIEIVAPVSGTVVDLTIHSKGAIVRAGDPFLEIVPNNDMLLIELDVEPQDIDNVRLGQSAKVKFSAFKQRTTPLLDGSVAYVSPDITQNATTGLPHYVVRISVTQDELDRLGDHEITPGMPAEIMISTGERTAARYLVQPILDSMNRAWREE